VNVAACAEAQSFFYHIVGRLDGEEEYLGIWGDVADQAGGFESVQTGEPDVEHNQIGTQLLRFADGFQSV